MSFPVRRVEASPACASAAVVEVETTSQASEPASQASDEEDAPATDIYFVSPSGSPVTSFSTRHVLTHAPTLAHVAHAATPAHMSLYACTHTRPHVHTLPHLHTVTLTWTHARCSQTHHTHLKGTHTRARALTHSGTHVLASQHAHALAHPSAHSQCACTLTDTGMLSNTCILTWCVTAAPGHPGWAIPRPRNYRLLSSPTL